jgi:hypothetical protein
LVGIPRGALIENVGDNKSVILVDNTIGDRRLGASQYASGKFFNIEKAILIGAEVPQLFQGTKKKSYGGTGRLGSRC